MRSSIITNGQQGTPKQYNDLRSDAYASSQLLAHEQDTPNLTLDVEAGIFYINNIKVTFAGGNSPSFTAPSTNPRIDLLTIDSSGTLARVVGTEASSPTVPVYPTNSIVICEVYNRVGQTTLRDIDTAGQGYIKSDSRKFINNIIQKFGGTGADGALNITSGATNIDLAGAQVVVKNYTSISITGTASLTFTNPHANGTTIVLKSQGNVTLTSSATPMIDARNCGASGGAPVGGALGTGYTGNNGYGFSMFQTNPGLGGYYSAQGGGGALASAISPVNVLRTSQIIAKYPFITPGAGGGGGNTYLANSQASDIAGTAGGRGGGALFIECGGAWNFTTTNGISVAGQNSANATGTTRGSNAYVTGSTGGGGGAGIFIAYYNVLTANSGTVSVSGGIGGNGLVIGTGQNPSIFGGGGGGSLINSQGGGGGGTSGTQSGSTGADGYSLIAQNTEFF